MFKFFKNFFFPKHDWITIKVVFSKDHRASVYIDGFKLTGKNKTIAAWGVFHRTESDKFKKYLRGGDK